MAKKVVATLKQAGGIKMVKVIKSFKNSESGSYAFKEALLPADKVEAHLKKK